MPGRIGHFEKTGYAKAHRKLTNWLLIERNESDHILLGNFDFYPNFAVAVDMEKRRTVLGDGFYA